MSLPDDRLLHLILRIPANHPQLLAGLEDWLQRGLISEPQVRQWCEVNLSSRVPDTQDAQDAQGLSLSAPASPLDEAIVRLPPISDYDFLPESQPKYLPIKVSPHPARGVSRLIQGLAEEISLRWLLFLGVFLVIVSSGVLAASQWNRFSPWAQYVVLLAYTTAFFGAGQICQRRSNLQLTTQTLHCVSLLLVPVNFWAMDGLDLWHSVMGWLTLVLAVPLLLVLSQRLTQTDRSLWGFAALSLLQWGWQIPLWPLITVYGGVFATQISSRFWGMERSPKTLTTPATPPLTPSQPLSFFGHWTIWYGLAILVLRAIFVAGVALPQLGLAIGLAGWFVTRPLRSLESLDLSQSQPSPTPTATHPVPRIAELLGMALLLVGWAVTLRDLPLQTIAISGLGLAFWGQRLGQQWKRQDWLTIVTIALQLGYQIWRIVPDSTQEAIVAWGTRITQTQDNPVGLLSLAGFVYVFGLVIVAQWFQVRRRYELVQLTDILTVLLTSVLLTLSLVSAPLRTFCFGLATIASSLTLLRPRKLLSEPSSTVQNWGSVYLTHGLAILTLLLGMEWFTPDWAFLGWARFTLGLAVLHWAVGLALPTPGSRLWHGQHSGLLWAIVFSLASYGFFFFSLSTLDPSPLSTLAWCVIPLLLTGLGYWHRRPRQFSGVSGSRLLGSQLLGSRFLKGAVLTVCLLQGLTCWFPATRQWGLLYGLANLMVISALAPRGILAGLTLGFGFLSSTLAINPYVQGSEWLIYWSVILNILWGVDRVLDRASVRFVLNNAQDPPPKLAPKFAQIVQIYQQALRGWSRTIAFGLGVFFTFTALMLSVFYRNITIVPLNVLGAVVLFGVALVQRSYPWRTNANFYTLAWGTELLLIHGLSGTQLLWLGSGLGNFPPYVLLWAHLGLGLTTQVLGNWLISRDPQRRSLVCFQVIPLLWAGLAGLSRWNLFTPWTGLITVGMSWIALQVGRLRVQQYQSFGSGWRAWSYVALGGFTLALAELIAYPLRDNLEILPLTWAGLGGALAIVYRYIAPQSLSTYFRIPIHHLRQLAHLHWGVSTGLMVLLFFVHLDTPNGAPELTLSTGVLLFLYALAQARHTSSEDTAVVWTYGSYLHLCGLFLYGWTIAPEIWQQGFKAWGLAIVAPLGLVSYLLPWPRWGWVAFPWQQVGVGVPLLLAIFTLSTATSGSWLVVAISYGALSYATGKLRLSYLALLFLDATVWRWCVENDRSGVLWYSLPLAASLLWVTAIDPDLKEARQRETRHNLRLCATALICGVPLFPGQGSPLVIIGLSLLSILAGLALRTRAFLYGGTAIFLGYSFYQLVILVTQQSLLKWAIGLGLGILMIWTAATFETRRDQIRTLLYNWADALADWD
jgi:hypothetical protein